MAQHDNSDILDHASMKRDDIHDATAAPDTEVTTDTENTGNIAASCNTKNTPDTGNTAIDNTDNNSSTAEDTSNTVDTDGIDSDDKASNNDSDSSDTETCNANMDIANTDGNLVNADSHLSRRETLIAQLVPVSKAIRSMWNRRPKLPFALYAIMFVAVTITCVLILQWSVYSETTYADDAQVDDTTRVMGTVAGQLTRFVSQMWLEQHWQFLLNCLVLGMIYLMTVTLLNRFWVATALFGTAMIVFAVANKCKVELRNEPLIPADFSFVSTGNTGELLSFVPEEDIAIIQTTVFGLSCFVMVCVLLQLLDGRNGLIPCHWRPSRFVSGKNIAAIVTRVLAFVASCALLISFVWNLSITQSWAQRWAQDLSDSPTLWNALDDARTNGTMMSFLRLVHASIMDEPKGYSEQTMKKIARRYAANADAINASRTANLTDSTVIMILSESFSNPTRVPGVAFVDDPMPNINAIKNDTTSGLLVSPSYGGGTANIEYQSLSGLNLALFDPSMLSVFQQLIPKQSNPYTFNRIWNDKYGETGSAAFHPYLKNMYFRDSNYAKFGFSQFMTLDSTPTIKYQQRNAASTYVSDAAAYQNVLDTVSDQEHPQFIQLITMQNHLPYGDYYESNIFYDTDLSSISDEDERHTIENYAKGINITDQATRDFLDQLDALDKPVTVIFYGDHLPSLYATASKDPDNLVTLHETDYFIWSNQASESANTKLSVDVTSLSSSNYLMATAAEHMGATVSPYLALLTDLHRQIPAISRIGDESDGWSEGEPTFLNAQGEQIDLDTLSASARQLLEDYRLVQYDLTAGESYLWDTNFLTVPETTHTALNRNYVPTSTQ